MDYTGLVDDVKKSVVKLGLFGVAILVLIVFAAYVALRGQSSSGSPSYSGCLPGADVYVVAEGDQLQAVSSEVCRDLVSQDSGPMGILQGIPGIGNDCIRIGPNGEPTEPGFGAGVMQVTWQGQTVIVTSAMCLPR